MISAPVEITGTKIPKAPFRSFFIILAICWTTLGAAAWALAKARGVPAEIAGPVALAFLTEISFYLLPGFRGLRAWITATYFPSRIAALVAATALLPYLIFAVPTAAFTFLRFGALACIMTAIAFWYVPTIRNRGWSAIRDVLFLAILASAILSGVFKWIYPAPIAKLPMEVLGHLTLVRCALFSMLVIRNTNDITFGFVPTMREFRIGLLWAVLCTACTLPIGLALGQIHFSARPWHPAQTILQLLGIFWFVALSEEFFFRALLQQWITSWTGSATAGLLAASCVYGACHLKFPNWRFAILAAVLGLFCGLAFQQARSMRASMITHTLVAGAFRLFLS